MDHEQLLLVFVSIIYEALPFVVLGVVLAGILEEFVPQQWISVLFQGGETPESARRRLILAPFRNRYCAIALGGILGLIFPMCECGIIAIMRRLMRKGVPLSICVCYMLAGPVINVVVMLSTYVAFNPPRPEDYVLGGPLLVVGLRVGLAFIVAFTTSLLVDWMYRQAGDKLVNPVLTLRAAALAGNNEEKRTWVRRLGNITETALHDFIDIMAFLVLGAALAAFGRGILAETRAETLFQQNAALSILVMMGIAVLFCLCSEADAFVAANFAAFWPPAAKLAFLVLGPMLDLKLFVIHTRIFRMRLIVVLICCLVIQVFVYCLLVHTLWPDHGFPQHMLSRMRQ